MTAEYRHNGGPPIHEESPFGPNGWIAIARDIRYHALVGFGKPVTPCDPAKGSYSRGEAWMDLMMECRFKDGVVNNNGRTMNLRRGQLLGANLWLAQRWNWTPKTVRGWLEKLGDEGMISFKNEETNPGPNEGQSETKAGRSKGRLANVITICNFNVFQMVRHQQGQVEGQEEGRLRAGSGQVEGDIYKEEQRNKGTKDYVGGAREARPPIDGLREGEEEVAPGLYVNCDAIRHKAFSISIAGIASQLAMSNIGLSANEAKVVARERAIAAALQWALEADAGKRVPDNLANMIRGSIVADKRREEAHQNAMRKGVAPWRGPAPPSRPSTRRSDGAAFLQAAADLDDEERGIITTPYKLVNP